MFIDDELGLRLHREECRQVYKAHGDKENGFYK